MTYFIPLSTYAAPASYVLYHLFYLRSSCQWRTLSLFLPTLLLPVTHFIPLSTHIAPASDVLFPSFYPHCSCQWQHFTHFHFLPKCPWVASDGLSASDVLIPTFCQWRTFSYFLPVTYFLPLSANDVLSASDVLFPPFLLVTYFFLLFSYVAPDNEILYPPFYPRMAPAYDVLYCTFWSFSRIKKVIRHWY